MVVYNYKYMFRAGGVDMAMKWEAGPYGKRKFAGTLYIKRGEICVLVPFDGSGKQLLREK